MLLSEAMRIISDFKDYYDFVQKEGQDLTLVYQRTSREQNLRCSFPLPVLRTQGKQFHLYPYVVGFCGKAYPMLHLSISGYIGGKWEGHENSHRRCYNLTEANQFIEAHATKVFLERYYKDTAQTRCKYGHPFYDEPRHYSVKKWFNEVSAPSNIFDTLFQSTSNSPVPIWTIKQQLREQHIVNFNAKLKDLEFYRIFATYNAFQEIAMWLGGLAAPGRYVPPVSDADMAVAKGFTKESFRKPKGTKRNKPRWR